MDVLSGMALFALGALALYGFIAAILSIWVWYGRNKEDR
jgi:hypothetical protein